jgi:hypothetical protein
MAEWWMLDLMTMRLVVTMSRGICQTQGSEKVEPVQSFAVCGFCCIKRMFEALVVSCGTFALPLVVLQTNTVVEQPYPFFVYVPPRVAAVAPPHPSQHPSGVAQPRLAKTALRAPDILDC